jgi:ABC-2 type transport system ATP-binding protein
MATTQIAKRRNDTIFSSRPAIAQALSVEKSYRTAMALRGVDLTLYSGEVLALLGPNGAGKTTLIRLLLGLASPSRGTVHLFGEDPRKVESRMRVGAMLQTGRVPETMLVKEHIDLFSSYYPKPLSLTEVLSMAGLQGIEKRQFGELSGGQKQRVLFALAICGDPDLLFLDEPTVGLDIESRRNLWDQIRDLVSKGKTVLLTTHYLEEADALADRIAVIHQGKIVAEGTPQEIKTKTAGKRIRCISTLPLETVSHLPDVVAAHYDRDAIEIQTSAAENTLRELLARDMELSGLEVSNAGIEEAFLALTQTTSDRDI